MKLSWGLFFSSLYCTASAAHASVSPETARLIIAQRLGLSRFHSIEHADAEAIQYINAFGGEQQKLFGGDDADSSKAHFLIWIEDGEDKEARVYMNNGASRMQVFAIAGHPSAADNNRLIQDFARQAESLPTPSDPKKQTYKSALEIESMVPSNTKLHTYNEYLNVLRLDKTDAFGDVRTLLIRAMEKALEQGFSVTAVVMPVTGTHAKRAVSAWGTYAQPAANGARRENPEALLSLNSAPSSSPAPVSDLEDFPTIFAQANDEGPVRGILPSCFNSQSACEKQTHNCSSHGACKLLHKGRGEGKDRQTFDCYGCACVPTVKHVGADKGMEESKKTVTYWGGPACQKKDISVQFWLFVATGVVLAFLVSSGIGMLYSMGAEELPSVIGAGVSGPVRK